MRKYLKESLLKAIPLFLSLSLTVLLFFIIYRFKGINLGISKLIKIMKPFVYGGVMAYLLKTPCNWFENKLKKLLGEKHPGWVKPISVITVMVLAFVIIYALLAMVIPALVDSIVRIANALPGVIDSLNKWLDDLLKGNEVLRNYVNSALDGFQTNGLEWIKGKILPFLTGLLGGLGSTVGGIFGILYNVIIGIIICIYLLFGKETFARQGKMIIYALFPRNCADWILKECGFIDKTFVGFFGGKILDSAIIGLICYVFCLILHFTMGVQNVVLIAVIVGVTNVIPYFGPYIGGIPAALLVLLDGPMACVVFVIFIILLQQFDGNILGPKLLSGSVGLTGIWVLFSITFFGGWMGFTGILIGVPVFAVIYDLIKRGIHHLLEQRHLKVADIPTYAQLTEQDDKPKKKKSKEKKFKSKGFGKKEEE
jgi:predicted PurR-regulated permease PerM